MQSTLRASLPEDGSTRRSSTPRCRWRRGSRGRCLRTGLVMRPTTYRLSRHARERTAEMGLRTKDVKQAIRDPDTSYPGSKRYGNGFHCYQRGRIVAIVDPENQTVVTVIWHRAEGRS